MTYLSRKELTNMGKVSQEQNENNSFVKQMAHIQTPLMDMKVLNTKIEENVYLNIVNNYIKTDHQFKMESEKKFLQIRFILQGNFEKLNITTQQKRVYQPNYIVVEYKDNYDYYLLNKKDEHLKYLCISIEESYLKENDFIEHIFKQKVKSQELIEIFEPELRSRYMELFEREYSNSIDKIYLKNKTMELIYFVLEKLQETNSSVVSLDAEDIKRVQKAKQILDNAFHTNITIATLAKEVALNQSKLKKGFKELYSYTIREYLVNIRLSKALEYIKTKEYSIKEVSHMVGYTNQASFSFAFSKKYHFSPKEFQKKY